MLPAAAPGIITGVVLALARIAGETAPLLFTAFNNRFLSTSLDAADRVADRAGLHLRHLAIRRLASSGLGGALVLVTLVLTCSLLARVATRRLERLQTGHDTRIFNDQPPTSPPPLPPEAPPRTLAAASAGP